MVAKAWTDPGFKKALLADATKAVASIGHMSRVGDHLVAVENTPKRHNMIVCTLCSCYPWEVLGPAAGLVQVGALPLARGEGPARRARRFRRHAAEGHRNPGVGFHRRDPLLVLPMRPAGTDGWSEDKLADLVTRDSMIGTGLPLNPGEVK